MIEIRSLKQNELEKWFDHCSNVFKEAPREYFVNHWYNDPWRNIDSIFVAVENDKILSTVRVFIREIYLNNKKITMGGIGEVSTIPEARKMGLSTKLLKLAINYMKNNNINISLLFGTHLNYSKLGWKSNEVCWKLSDTNPCKGFYNIRKVNFNNDIEQLKNIYKKCASQFNGAIIRDDDSYWMHWIKSETKNCFVAENNLGNIIGYMSANIENNITVINDFSMDLEYDNVFEELSSYICTAIGKSTTIKYPAVINSSLKVKSYEISGHNMFRLISPFKLENNIINSTEDLISSLNDNKTSEYDTNFLFWNVDGF